MIILIYRIKIYREKLLFTEFIFVFIGSFGVHVVMNSHDNYTHAFYGKLGFVQDTHEVIKEKIVMGRCF